jgi:hypothetical protein
MKAGDLNKGNSVADAPVSVLPGTLGRSADECVIEGNCLWIS